MLPPESLEGGPEVGFVKDGEGPPSDVLITLVSPGAEKLFRVELWWAEG